MESLPVHGSLENEIEKPMSMFTRQLEAFETKHQNETFETSLHALDAFAKFIEEESLKTLEYVRTLEKYKDEKEIAKFHEFNLKNAEVISRYAELRDKYPESLELLRRNFPWLEGIEGWLQQYEIKHAITNRE